MSDVAIHIDELSKRYHIGGPQKQYDRLGEQMVDMLASPFRRAGRLARGQAGGATDQNEIIWALKDVSFDIKHGEVIGIIGRNGAGKSTLLKILSRITEPTEGYVDVFGRIGSLLEVGTGFHPELTGRENIYLNGAILGMTKREIESKMDEIISFAEIGKFIHTPVKHYSSGMYIRLAFSVAAHLDPEILLVDEVLAVGDAAFQKKCLGKMGDVSRRGRTVLFVSHNMAVIQTLCQRGVYLEQGQVVADGPITEVVSSYLKSLEQVQFQNVADRTDRRGKGQVKLVGVEITDGRNSPASLIRAGGPVRFAFDVSGMLANLSCGFVILDDLGQPLSLFKSDVPGPEDQSNPDGRVRFVCEMDELMLVPGRYRINVFIRGGGMRQDLLEAAAFFDVEGGNLRGRPILPPENERISATMPHRWVIPY
jgi:lipopolysaccharide transport system ATP-binding protein